jgi:group I intron endonuclease
MFVYLITNTVNGKRYVGQTTTTLEERWRLHQKLKNCRLLHNAIQKYGSENFIVEAICQPPSIELMNEFEAEYIKRYCTLVPNGYNLTEGGRVPRHSEETRRKMSESHKGKFHGHLHDWTDEERKDRSVLYSGCNNPNAKLKSEQVQEIRSLYLTGDFTQTELADRFGIKQPQVSSIILNQKHKNKEATWICSGST